MTATINEFMSAWGQPAACALTTVVSTFVVINQTMVGISHTWLQLAS